MDLYVPAREHTYNLSKPKEKILYSIMSNQPYIFSRVTAHDVISIHALNAYISVLPLITLFIHLPETSTAESRGPIICPVVAPNLQGAWYRNQTQPSAPQAFLYFFLWFLKNIKAKEKKKKGILINEWNYEEKNINIDVWSLLKYLMIRSSFPLHAVVIQQLYNQIKKQNQIIIPTLIELYSSTQQAYIPYILRILINHLLINSS